METYNTVCAWCNRLLRGDPDADQTSHGICTSCYIEHTRLVESVQTLWGSVPIGQGLPPCHQSQQT